MEQALHYSFAGVKVEIWSDNYLNTCGARWPTWKCQMDGEVEVAERELASEHG